MPGNGGSFECFACGRAMEMLSIRYGWCEPCDVMEMRYEALYFSRTRTFLSQPYGGEELRYLDHSLGSYPSPA